MSKTIGCGKPLENGKRCGYMEAEEYGVSTGYCPACFGRRKNADLEHTIKELKEELVLTEGLEAELLDAYGQIVLWRTISAISVAMIGLIWWLK